MATPLFQSTLRVSRLTSSNNGYVIAYQLRPWQLPASSSPSSSKRTTRTNHDRSQGYSIGSTTWSRRIHCATKAHQCWRREPYTTTVRITAIARSQAPCWVGGSHQLRSKSSDNNNNGGPPRPSPPPIRKRILDSLNVTPHENIYTLPNLLTFSRLLAAPAIGYLVLHDQHAWAVGLFAYAGITDLIDGYIARTWRLQTVVGTVIDPMADKTLMTILTVCLAIKGGLPVWLAAIILGRDVGLGLAAIYYRWISLPPPKTFNRYWDFSLPSVEVHPTGISKINTALQLALIGACTAQPLLISSAIVSPEVLSPMMKIMQYVVATTTIWSGASYVYTKDALKFITPSSSSSTSSSSSSSPSPPPPPSSVSSDTPISVKTTHDEKRLSKNEDSSTEKDNR